jgi:hypothetical protein
VGRASRVSHVDDVESGQRGDFEIRSRLWINHVAAICYIGRAHLQMTRKDQLSLDNKLCEDAATTCHAFELSIINTTSSILFPLSLSAQILQMMNDIKAFGISLWVKVASHGQY